jgi:cell wall-associated NlpC family hydrolase
MKAMYVDRAELVRLMKLCFSFSGFVAKVKYIFGAKPALGDIPGLGFFSSDCSGFVRWLIHGATHGQVKMPSGSWYQQAWVKKEGYKKTSYLLHAGLHDNRLRIAFINPKNGIPGHVWLVINGQTIESYGGHGAGRRKWDTPVLLKNVDACYVLTEPMP